VDAADEFPSQGRITERLTAIDLNSGETKWQIRWALPGCTESPALGRGVALPDVLCLRIAGVAPRDKTAELVFSNRWWRVL